MPGDLRTEIDDAEIRAAFDRLKLRMAPGGMRGTLAEIGRYGKSSTQLRFRTQTAPDGTPWKKSKRAIERGGQTLRDTGRLRNSISWDVSSEGVAWGTNVKYGAAHQRGYSNERQPVRAHTRRMTMAWGRRVRNPRHVPVGGFTRRMSIEARPYLGLSAADRQEILAILAEGIDAR